MDNDSKMILRQTCHIILIGVVVLLQTACSVFFVEEFSVPLMDASPDTLMDASPEALMNALMAMPPEDLEGLRDACKDLKKEIKIGEDKVEKDSRQNTYFQIGSAVAGPLGATEDDSNRDLGLAVAVIAGVVSFFLPIEKNKKALQEARSEEHKICFHSSIMNGG